MSIVGTNPQEAVLQDKSVGERIGAGLVGLLLGDIGSAIYGSASGFDKSFAKQVALQIGLVVGMTLLGVTNPFIMFGVILTGGIGQLLMRGNALTEQVKEKVGQKVAEEIKSSKATQAKNIADKVISQLSTYTQPIEENLTNEILSLRGQVEETLRNKKEGEKKVSSKLAELVKLNQELKGLDESISDFTFTIAGLNTNEKL